MRKDFKAIQRLAEAQGFKVTRTNGDHLKWTSPSGACTFSPSTPSDGRSVQNLKANLKKIGFQSDWKKPKIEKESTVVDIRSLPDRTPTVNSQESANCKVAGCGKRILNSKMADHMLTLHGVYTCTECGQEFPRTQALGRHMSSAHKMNAKGEHLIPCVFPGCESFVSPQVNGMVGHFNRIHKISYPTWLQNNKPQPVEEAVLEPVDKEVITQQLGDLTPLMTALLQHAHLLTPERWEILGEWVQDTRATLKVLE